MSALTAVYVPDLPSATERALEARRIERELMKHGYNHLHRVLPMHASRAHAHALDAKPALALAKAHAHLASKSYSAFQARRAKAQS